MSSLLSNWARLIELTLDQEITIISLKVYLKEDSGGILCRNLKALTKLTSYGLN